MEGQYLLVLKSFKELVNKVYLWALLSDNKVWTIFQNRLSYIFLKSIKL